MPRPVQLSHGSFKRTVVELGARDGRLAAIVERHGIPEFWFRPAGFATLLLLILEQQVSLASARAAFTRVDARVGGVTPEGLLTLSDAELREDGFSRQKTRYARALAEKIVSRELDLDGFRRLDDDDVRTALVALLGVGAWTAEVYLLSALALRHAQRTAVLERPGRRLEAQIEK